MPAMTGTLGGGAGAKPGLYPLAKAKAMTGRGSEAASAAAIAAKPCADRGRRLVEAVAISSLAFKYGPHDLRGDREVVLAVVRANWRALEHANEEFRADRGIVLAAVSEGGEDALRLAALEVRRDPEMKAAASRASSQQFRRPVASVKAAPAVPAGLAPSFGSRSASGGGPTSFSSRRVAPAIELPEDDGPSPSRAVPMGYAWLEGGALELEAPRDLGQPVVELLRPAWELGPGVRGLGTYLRVVFPGSKLKEWGPEKQLRLPVPYGTIPGAVLDVKATSRSQHVDAVEERRVDPEDQLFCTLAHLREKYIGRYNEAEIKEYWEVECDPLDESLWIRHDETPKVTWSVRPAVGSFRCAAPPADKVAMQAEVLAEELQDRGYGVVDGFLQAAEADAVHALMRKYWADSRFKAGMIGVGIQKSEVRGDLSCIGELGSLPEVLKPVQQRIKQLVSRLSRSVDGLNKRGPVDCEPPMMAVYPGGGARYMRHFDGLEGQQKSGLLQPRVCTLIAYFNPFWSEEHGGQLRLYPDDVAGPPDAITITQPSPDERVVNVEPLHGRLLAFLCQGRNAHEVMPSWRPRFAVTWWVRELRPNTAGWEALAS